MDHEIKDRGSVLLGPARGMSGQLASEMLDEGVIEEMMPPQETYRNKRRKELRRLLFNLIRARSLSRAHETRITVGVPLRKIYHNEDEYHRVSYRGLKAMMDGLSDAGLVEVDKGKRFIDASSEWKRKCFEDGELKGKMTEVWAREELKEEIDEYLSTNTDVGADVEMLVEEDEVVLRDNDGHFIRPGKGGEADRMRQAVQAVNGAVRRPDVRLVLPAEVLGGSGVSLGGVPLFPLSSNSSCSSFPISVHTSPQQATQMHQEVMHQQVQRRCPQAWAWEHEMRGRALVYHVPGRALTYRRKFVRGSWDCGGRFYAPVQNVPSGWRRHMRIGGKPVVELDYDHLHVAMLYAEEGLRLEEDAYDITSRFDLGARMDELVGLTEEERKAYEDRQRAVVKTALNVLINAENHQAAYKALKTLGWEEKIGLPVARDVFKPLVRALRERHEPIEDYLHSDIGIRLQRKDSDLAERVMTETGAIGIHDGFVIEASREQELKEAMKRAFAEEHDGYDIGVSREFKPLNELNEETGGASDDDTDFASDRPAKAESGAERKPKSSPTPS